MSAPTMKAAFYTEYGGLCYWLLEAGSWASESGGRPPLEGANLASLFVLAALLATGALAARTLLLGPCACSVDVTETVTYST